MVDRELIDQINQNTDIVSLASEFTKLEPRGRNYFGLSPFVEEKTPSFSVSPEKNIAKCFSSGLGGTPIVFYSQVKNISFEEAALELAARLGIEIKQASKEKDFNEPLYQLLEDVSTLFQLNLKNSVSGEKALDYLHKRTMSDEIIDHFKIGYASKGDQVYQFLKDRGYLVSDMIDLGLVKQNDQGAYYDLFQERIMFPITNPKGRVVGFSGRTIQSKEQVKYMNSPETKLFKKGQLLYQFHESSNAIRQQSQAVLYEGFFDVISAYVAGKKNGVATMGTALTKDQAQLLKSMTNHVVIAYDGDQAGLKASDHAIGILQNAKLSVEILTIPEGQDPDEYVKDYGPQAFQKLFDDATEDAYAFRYRYYKKNLNLENANDITLFKSLVTQMLKYADSAVQNIYKKRLAEDLGLKVEEVYLYKESSKTVKRVNKKRDKLKYKHAESNIISAMLQDQSIANHIYPKIEEMVAPYTPVFLTIPKKIMAFYQKYDQMSLPPFYTMCSEEEIEYIQEIISSNALYKRKEFSIQNIKESIQCLAAYPKEIEIEELRTQRDLEEKTIEEKMKINKKIQKLEEEKGKY